MLFSALSQHAAHKHLLPYLEAFLLVTRQNTWSGIAPAGYRLSIHPVKYFVLLPRLPSYLSSAWLHLYNPSHQEIALRYHYNILWPTDPVPVARADPRPSHNYP